MTKTNKGAARKPASKLPNLQKKMRHNKTQAQQARKK
jgi:hypothetical protein